MSSGAFVATVGRLVAGVDRAGYGVVTVDRVAGLAVEHGIAGLDAVAEQPVIAGTLVGGVVTEQLAGDELISRPHSDLTPEQIEKLTATGFLRMAPDGSASNGVDLAVSSNETIADTINIVSTSLLGLTVGCARCHNHRYDPISQVEYYRLRAIFEPALDWKNWNTPNQRLHFTIDQRRPKDPRRNRGASKTS